jgi:glutamine synthetase
MKDLYVMSDLDRERENIDSLPHDLYAAIQDAERSQLMRDTLGEELTSKLVETKYKEWRDYSLAITPRELRQNLFL